MKSFTAGMTPTEKGNAKRIMGYEIAKLVYEEASTYSEAMEILAYAEREFKVAMELSEPRIGDGPRGMWGERLETPGSGIPEAKTGTVMVDLQQPQC